jgi:adenylate kinase
VGKSSFVSRLCDLSGLRAVHVGEIALQKKLYSGRDEERQCFVVDEDALVDELEPLLAEGGAVVDYHICSFFPERWFQLVIVLRCGTTPIFDRLTARGYAQSKISENVEAEIMQVVRDDAFSSYQPEIIVELSNDSLHDLASNLARTEEYLTTVIKKLIAQQTGEQQQTTMASAAAASASSSASAAAAVPADSSDDMQ